MRKVKNTLPGQLGASGLGLRDSFLNELLEISNERHPINFLEVAPENWLNANGHRLEFFREYAQHYPIIHHGLSLSIGSIAPLDINYLQQLKSFFSQHSPVLYSEHLSYCSDEHGYLYDLMPIPFTEEAVHYVANRVKQTQEILERQIALENVSYYALPKGDMTEAEFINAVINEANCLLLLDVNNVYINSVNHNYDAPQFLCQMPKNKIAYIHIAGHFEKEADLIIDTHGAAITPSVWDLLELSYQQFGLIPTVIERDNNIPPLSELLEEVDQLKQIQSRFNCHQGNTKEKTHVA